mmetsp:Transcript_29323/g.65047  ORF Transcript_29323/g.65047 Transcript_29323/m.65047 type:complete len:214 (+) Transcript_29323:1259-1900(+)
MERQPSSAGRISLLDLIRFGFDYIPKQIRRTIHLNGRVDHLKFHRPGTRLPFRYGGRQRSQKKLDDPPSIHRAGLVLLPIPQHFRPAVITGKELFRLIELAGEPSVQQRQGLVTIRCIGNGNHERIGLVDGADEFYGRSGRRIEVVGYDRDGMVEGGAANGRIAVPVIRSGYVLDGILVGGRYERGNHRGPILPCQGGALRRISLAAFRHRGH